MIKCEQYLSQVCNLSAHKILIVGSLYSFVKGLLHGEVGKATCTPFKSTPVKKHFARHSRGKESYPRISSSFFTSLKNSLEIFMENFNIWSGEKKPLKRKVMIILTSC